GDSRAELGFGHGQVDLREDVVSFAREARVGADVDEDVDVAGIAAGQTGMALARDADPLAVVDSGRDLDVELPLLHRATGAAALLARRLDDATGAVAARAGRGADELAEDAARHLLEPPAPAARRALDRAGARLGAAPLAGVARDGHLERHLLGDSGRGLDELDLDLCADVRAAPGTACADAEQIVAEEGGEQVAEVAQVEGRREPAAA